MLIGAYGRFWDADKVDWSKASLLGKRGKSRKTMNVVDFGAARGVYVLYDDLGIYYAGLCRGRNGLGGRLKDHLKDHHRDKWTRFSWFSFDSPDFESDPDGRGIYSVALWEGIEGAGANDVVEDLEALLIAAMRPFANKRNPKFGDAEEWEQVAEKSSDVQLFDDIKHLLSP
ncbi:GIY-YIG nuclease family protein [Aeromicrobium sp. CF3.5]|uniref:GIY-YIG nuclease family protein n=1 Tax=Aeromicrobium sp. CF3.5 TaxID=3373078 RepID=UPI003EE5F8C9